MTTTPLPLAVSMGDPCGIGPDIILNAWQRSRSQLPDFFVVGSADVLKQRAVMMGLDLLVTTEQEARPSKDHLMVEDLGIDTLGKPAAPESHDAHLTIEAIRLGVELVHNRKASALVTCPINKKVLYDVGFEHPGHTEFLAHLCKSSEQVVPHPVMMLAGPELRTVPVTIHIPLIQVASALTIELIMKTCRIVHHDLKKRYLIKEPRLAVSGLNPHAGENGSLGREDSEIIAPAIEHLRSEGVNAFGPLPADTMFHASARSTYDVAICMYHDQALIPAKMLGFDDAVNVTLGLPIIRTSPDHGTAYDIAGTGKANPSSFIASLKMAAEMTQSNAGQS